MMTMDVVLKIHEGAMRLVVAGWARSAAVKESVKTFMEVETALNKLEGEDTRKRSLRCPVCEQYHNGNYPMCVACANRVINEYDEVRPAEVDRESDETIANRYLRDVLHMTKKDFYEMFPGKKKDAGGPTKS